ncbi:MAG: hypothetical protein ACYTFM_00850, partial [Planctomycetota bacterium]
SERWRYIKYSNGFEELYDHSEDIHEYANLAGDKKYADVIKELSKYIPDYIILSNAHVHANYRETC